MLTSKSPILAALLVATLISVSLGDVIVSGSIAMVGEAIINQAPGDPAGIFVSTAGVGSGACTWAAPCSLTFALDGAGGTITAGETAYLRGGTYTCHSETTSLSGSAGNQITFRSYPGEWAILENSTTADTGFFIHLTGSYITIRDVEFRGTASVRTAEGPSAFWDSGTFNQSINNVYRDVSGAGAIYTDTAIGSLYYGNVIYNLGFELTGASPDGHPLYLRKSSAGPDLTVAEQNVMGNSSGICMQWWITTGEVGMNLDGLTFKNNVCFNNGFLDDSNLRHGIFIGAPGFNADDVTIDGNDIYVPNNAASSYSAPIRADDSGTAPVRLVVTDNYIAGLGTTAAGAFIELWNNVVFTGNTVISLTGNIPFIRVDVPSSPGAYNWETNAYQSLNALSGSNFQHEGNFYTFANWKTNTTWDDASTATGSALPTVDVVHTRINAYQSGRGFIVVWNWDNSATQDLTVSSILTSGDAYEIRSAQDYYTVLASGTWTSGVINVDTTAGVAAPTSASVNAPADLGPLFNVYVICKDGCLEGH